MNREEYMNLRLQRDFFRYTVLSEVGKSVSEIAEALEITAHGTQGDNVLANLRNIASKELQNILDEEFAFDKLKDGDSFVKRLPDGFGPELIQKAADRYRAFLESDVMKEPQSEVVCSLIHAIEKHCWRSGFRNMSEGIALFLANTRKKAAGYRSCSSAVDYKEKIAKEYARANNTDRIIAFRSTLKDAARIECENLLYNNVADFLDSVAERSRIVEMVDYAAKVRECALARMAGLPELENNVEYEKEYYRQIPLSFYSRNIEKADLSKAFYMIMMLAMAYFEDELVAKGYLADGEMCFFTREQHVEPSVIFDDVMELMARRKF